MKGPAPNLRQDRQRLRYLQKSATNLVGHDSTALPQRPYAQPGFQRHQARLLVEIKDSLTRRMIKLELMEATFDETETWRQDLCIA